jgi:hypothetical protein
MLMIEPEETAPKLLRGMMDLKNPTSTGEYPTNIPTSKKEKTERRQTSTQTLSGW